MSSAATTGLMTADEFLLWHPPEPTDTKYELVDGIPIAMEAERVIHAEIKTNVGSALLVAIRSKRLPCQVMTDGVAVRVGSRTTYVPDIVARCGPRLDPNIQEVNDPLVVVEILSPSTAKIDLNKKLIGYFAVPSLAHYLIVSPDDRKVLHYRRQAGGTIETLVLDERASVTLDPPGIELRDLFPPSDVV